MSLQALVDAMNAGASAERSHYHMTLGGLIAALESEQSDVVVEFDNGTSPDGPHSYRGYYCDLSLPPSSYQITVGALLNDARDAVGQTFEGYKGGDFTMHSATPLWASPYGSANGVAIMGHRRDGDKFILITKQID